MDEGGAVSAIVTVIENATSTLLSGLEQNGAAREIGYISPTLLSMPTSYYGFDVHCENAREQRSPEFDNSAEPNPYVTEYSMAVIVFEHALPDAESDGEHYCSAAHGNFRSLCDRTVKLLRRTHKWLPSQSSSPRYRVKDDRESPGRAVSKENHLPDPTDEGFILASTIRFKLVGCNDG